LADRRIGRFRKRRALSPVIATIILSAVVIAIGGAIWSYASGASTVIANDYVNGTLDLMNEIVERFVVEHATNTSDGSNMSIWVYNYGDVDIIVDVYANATSFNGSTYSVRSNLTNSVSAGGLVEIEIHFSTGALEPGDTVAVKVHSRRQNNAYYRYIVS
jgi:flagellin-like protein